MKFTIYFEVQMVKRLDLEIEKYADVSKAKSKLKLNKELDLEDLIADEWN